MNKNPKDSNELWKNMMRQKSGFAKERMLNDEIERAFWKKQALVYDKNPNLYDDLPIIGECLYELIGKEKRVLEIGCGTGKFTLPIAAYSKNISGVDLSKEMLSVLIKKAERNAINNVKTYCCQWEEWDKCEEVEVILSVNSLYRIYDIEKALLKMNKIAKERVIIVRTIQDPTFDSLYEALGFGSQKVLDYQLMEMVLMKMGIASNVEYYDYIKTIHFESEEELQEEIKRTLPKKANLREVLSQGAEFLKKSLIKTKEGYTYYKKQEVMLLHWKPRENNNLSY